MTGMNAWFMVRANFPGRHVIKTHVTLSCLESVAFVGIISTNVAAMFLSVVSTPRPQWLAIDGFAGSLDNSHLSRDQLKPG